MAVYCFCLIWVAVKIEVEKTPQATEPEGKESVVNASINANMLTYNANVITVQTT